MAFAALALASAAALVAIAPAATRAALRQPLVIVLVGLAVVTAASGLWTIGSPADAARWGAVGAGYAAMATAGFVCVRAGGAVTVAGLVLALALVCAGLGLIGATLRVEPLAERIGGSWRPGGPLEYPPALGALTLAAAPLALRLMAGVGVRTLAGAATTAVLAATVALISARATLGLAALLLIAAAAVPSLLGVARPLVLAAIAFALTAGLAADAVAGSYAEPYAYGGDAPRLLGLVGLVLLAAGLWAALRPCFDERGMPHAGRGSRALALALVPLAIAVIAAVATPDAGEAVEPDSGITHGRTDTWAAAVETALDRPLEGTGALTFLTASGARQDPPPTRFAHDLVLENWVELGIAGLALSLAFVGIAVALIARSRGDAVWLLAPGASAFLIAVLIDWPWHIPAAGGAFLLMLGGLAAGRDRALFGSAGRI